MELLDDYSKFGGLSWFSSHLTTERCMVREEPCVAEAGFAKMYRGKFQHSLRLFRSFPGFNFSCKPSGCCRYRIFAVSMGDPSAFACLLRSFILAIKSTKILANNEELY
jgi:hypothetical protein